MGISERRADLRGARDERLFLKVQDFKASSGSDVTLSCRTLDVSASGMRLVSSEPLSENTPLELWVEIKGCPGKYFLNGVVRWCYRNDNEGMYVCGVELLESDNESDLADWKDLFV